MTKSAAVWIHAGFVVGILPGVAYRAQAQNLTYFREYDIQPPANNQPGFTSDGRGGLYASTGDAEEAIGRGDFQQAGEDLETACRDPGNALQAALCSVDREQAAVC